MNETIWLRTPESWLAALSDADFAELILRRAVPRSRLLGLSCDCSVATAERLLDVGTAASDDWTDDSWLLNCETDGTVRREAVALPRDDWTGASVAETESAPEVAP